MQRPPQHPTHLRGYKDKGVPFKDVLRDRCRQRLRQAREDVVLRRRFVESSTLVVHALVEEEIQQMREDSRAYNQDADDLALTEAELDHLRETMDEISEELRREELQMLAEYELQYAEQADLAAVEDDPAAVGCPVCKENRLLQNKQVIFCPCGQLRLNTQQDHVTLPMLKHSLAIAVGEHSGGCEGEPVFSVDTRFGFEALLMTCAACSTFYVVC